MKLFKTQQSNTLDHKGRRLRFLESSVFQELIARSVSLAASDHNVGLENRLFFGLAAGKSESTLKVHFSCRFIKWTA